MRYFEPMVCGVFGQHGEMQVPWRCVGILVPGTIFRSRSCRSCLYNETEGQHKTHGTAVVGLMMSGWPCIRSGWIQAKSITRQRSPPTSSSTRSTRRCLEAACWHRLGPKSRCTVARRISREGLHGKDLGCQEEYATAYICRASPTWVQRMAMSETRRVQTGRPLIQGYSCR